MQCTHCMFTCLLPLVINTKSLQNLSITWERNVLFFFVVFISSISHSPASQFHIGRIFARHWSSRTRPSPPRRTAHRSASRRPLPPCEKSGRLLLSHQLPFYPDTGWKGLFLFKKNKQYQKQWNARITPFAASDRQRRQYLWLQTWL